MKMNGFIRQMYKHNQIKLLIFSVAIIASTACSSYTTGNHTKMNNVYIQKNMEGVDVAFARNPWYQEQFSIIKHIPKRKSRKNQFNKKYPRRSIPRLAQRYVGIPYKYGGENPKEGFDCSGFVKYVYSKVGKSLPRSSVLQFSQGKYIHPKNALPGDLIFFDINGRGISHVGIYMGNMRFIHAPKKGSHVKIVTLLNEYWKKRFKGVRRVQI